MIRSSPWSRVPCAAGFALASMSQLARADEVAPLMPPPPPYVVSEPVRTRLHDGFYLRGSLGLGSLWAHRTFTATGTPDVATTTSGGVGAFELSLGGTPTPGLVLAGSLFTHHAPTPRTSSGGVSSRDDGTLTLSMLAFTVDWYPRPARGFHAGGSIGGATLRSSTMVGSSGFDARGPAIAFTVGQDYWAGDDLSVGFLGRFVAAAVSDRGPREPLVASPDTAYAVTIAFTVAYH